jgi:hypothetical protein
MNILQANKKWQKLDFDNIQNEIIRDSEKELIELLTERQMIYGEAEENIIGHYYNKSYGRMKKQMNPKAGGLVDLKLTGLFWKEMFLTISKEFFLITSKVSYFSEIIAKYGMRVMGLNKRNLELYKQNTALPETRKKIRDAIF